MSKDPGAEKRYRHSIKGWISRRLRKIKDHEKKHGYKSNIDGAYLQMLLVDKCPVFGYDLIYGGTGMSRPPNLAALDRIDNNIGYMKGNLHIISDHANSMKRNATYDELLRFAKWAQEMFE